MLTGAVLGRNRGEPVGRGEGLACEEGAQGPSRGGNGARQRSGARLGE